jgi:ectoine hydroxylase-related dioxygenase (phytanoyl-CoA dioxygenase family)
VIAGEALSELRRAAERVRLGSRTLLATNGESLVDSYLWLTEAECRSVIVAGTLARLAARAMRARTVRLFYDQVFAKTAGASAPTRWHQDLSHWPLRGEQICSIWRARTAGENSFVRRRSTIR